MVDKWTSPDYTSQTASSYKANLDNAAALNNLIAGDYFVHAQDTPDMTVKASAGKRFIGGTLTSDAAQNTGTITAPATNPRIDRVCLDPTDGTISVVTGTESTSPAAPSITGGLLPLCQISLTTSTTSITNSDITDERTYVSPAQRVAFSAYRSSDASNVTGTGTDYTVVFDSENADYGSNFDTSTGVFTAPVDGIYMFTTSVRLDDFTTSTTQISGRFLINSTDDIWIASYDEQAADTAGGRDIVVSGTFVRYLSASDTVAVVVDVSGEASDLIDVLGNASGEYANFSGALLM